MKHSSKLKLNNDVKVFNVFKYLVLIFAFLLVGLMSGEKVEGAKDYTTSTTEQTDGVMFVVDADSGYPNFDDFKICGDIHYSYTGYYPQPSCKTVSTSYFWDKLEVFLSWTDKSKSYYKLDDNSKQTISNFSIKDYLKSSGTDANWEAWTDYSFVIDVIARRCYIGGCDFDTYPATASDSTTHFKKPTITLTPDSTDYAKSHSVVVAIVDDDFKSATYKWISCDLTTEILPSFVNVSFSTTKGNNKHSATLSNSGVDGCYKLYVLAKDNVGNTKMSNTAGIYFDNAGPTIRFSDYESNKLKKSHTVTVTVADGAGVNSTISYKWADSRLSNQNLDSTATLSSNMVTLTLDKITAMRLLIVKACDTLGHCTEAKSVWLYVDNTPPTVTPDTVSTDPANNHNAPSFTITDYDHENNDVTTIYKWSQSDSNVDFSSGTTTTPQQRTPTANAEEIWYYCAQATDSAGNVGVGCSEGLKFDNKIPSIGNVTLTQNVSSYTGSATVTDANLSGVTYTWFLNGIEISGQSGSIDSPESGTSMSSNSYSMEKQHGSLKICYDATDGAGNSADGVCYEISVDHKLPEIGEIKITGGGCINCSTSSTNNKVISEKIEVINNSIVYSEVVVEEDIEVVLYSVVIEDVELDVLEEGIKTDTIEEIPEEIAISEVNHLHVKVKRKENKVFSLLEYKILYIDDRKGSLLSVV